MLQANYVLSNPDASPISYMARVGNTLEYDFFYAPEIMPRARRTAGRHRHGVSPRRAARVPLEVPLDHGGTPNMP